MVRDDVLEHIHGLVAGFGSVRFSATTAARAAQDVHEVSGWVRRFHVGECGEEEQCGEESIYSEGGDIRPARLWSGTIA